MGENPMPEAFQSLKGARAMAREKTREILPRQLPSPHSSQIANHGPTISSNGWFCAKVVLKRKPGCLSARFTITSLLIVSLPGRAEPAVHTHHLPGSLFFVYENFSL